MSSKLRKIKGIVPPMESGNVRHVYSMYTIRVKNRAGTSRDTLMRYLNGRGIDCRVYFTPVHLQPAFRALCAAQSFPFAEEAAREVVTLPLYPELRGRDIDFIMRSIEAAVK